MTTATQAPERIKLSAAGASIQITIESAEQVPVGRYPEYAFVGTDGGGRLVDLRVPKASADRQLGRLEMALSDTIGWTLLFSRDENESDPSKPFWGISQVSKTIKAGPGTSTTAGVALPRPAGTTQPPAPANPPAPVEEKQSALYLRMTKWTLDEIVPLYVKAGIPVTMEGTAAIVATNFIAKNGRH